MNDAFLQTLSFFSICYRGTFEFNRSNFEVLHEMDDEGFFFHMRMSKEIFAKLLEKVQHHYQERNATSSHTGGRTEIPLIYALSMTDYLVFGLEDHV